LRWSDRFPQAPVTNSGVFCDLGLRARSRPDRAQDFGLVFVLGHKTGEAPPERSLVDLR
jgi:hypothetical protein